MTSKTESKMMPYPSENDVLTSRSTSMVLIVLTGLLAFCWVLTDDTRIQAGTFVCGLAAVVTWLSYCQMKTTSEVSNIIAKQKRIG